MPLTRKVRTIKKAGLEKAGFSSFSKYVEARDRRIVTMGRQGLTAREISAAVGVSLPTIYRLSAKTSGSPFGRNKNRERNKRIVVLRRQNWMAQEIADEVGCSLATVHRIIAKGGPFPSGSGRSGWVKNRERHKNIVILRRQNWIAQEIADEVGCSLATVYRIIAKSGPFPSRGGRSGWVKNHERHKNIAILRRQGWAAQEIADTVGCSSATVYRIIGKKRRGAQA